MVGSGRVNSLIHTGGKKINWGPVDSIRDILQISKELSGPHILRVIAPPNSITLGLTPSKCKLLGDIQHTNDSSYTALLTYLWVLDWTLKTNERQILYCTYFTTKIFFKAKEECAPEWYNLRRTHLYNLSLGKWGYYTVTRVPQATFELLILLPSLLGCWHYRYAQPPPAWSWLLRGRNRTQKNQNRF